MDLSGVHRGTRDSTRESLAIATSRRLVHGLRCATLALLVHGTNPACKMVRMKIRKRGDQLVEFLTAERVFTRLNCGLHQSGKSIRAITRVFPKQIAISSLAALCLGQAAKAQSLAECSRSLNSCPVVEQPESCWKTKHFFRSPGTPRQRKPRQQGRKRGSSPPGVPHSRSNAARSPSERPHPAPRSELQPASSPHRPPLFPRSTKTFVDNLRIRSYNRQCSGRQPLGRRNKFANIRRS